MKISFITTVFNEEHTIKKFIDSLFSQTKLAHEIIIVDGGSNDATVARIKYLVANSKDKKIKRVKFKVLIKHGNRSIGRNEAIKQASGDIIVCSDAGNILDKDWIKNISAPFKTWKVDVVAGYYKGKPKNIFQKCLIPYALVMPDKVNPDDFLPATRSIAFTKNIWKKVGGFDETLSHNEDYVFANRLKEKKAKIVFAKDAIVYWLPRNTYKEAFIMFFRFSLGDAESSILRTTVLLLFARYFLGLYFIFLSLLYKSFFPLILLFVSVVFYMLWSIRKNYKYVKEYKAIQILPLLQYTADIAVLTGTTVGLLKRIIRFHYLLYLKQNIFLFFIVAVYGFIILLTFRWGVPNQNHPFPYHMDEWHQLQAVANTFRYGTPNTEGSANGTLFHFLISGFYLIPFVITNYINPFALEITNSFMRERVFEVLRLNTIIWGALAIIILAQIARLLGISQKLTLLLFTFTPIWIMLSGYFKYDIALIFWILLSLLCFLRFGKKPTHTNYLLAAIPASLAVAVKVSAIPLFPLYLLLYFMFRQKNKWDFRYIIVGTGTFLGILLFFGMPDALFGKGNILSYLYDNILNTPGYTDNYLLGTNVYEYLFFKQYPLIFGYGLTILAFFAVTYSLFSFARQMLARSFTKNKFEIFLLISFLVFLFSILPLKIFAGGNRSLILLPFFVLISGVFIQKLFTKKKLSIFVWGMLLIVMTVQFYQLFAFIYLKVVEAPQVQASKWIEKHIAAGQKIGIENIPIYQYLPDLIQKEFYFSQYRIETDKKYSYEVIDSNTKKLPNFIVITNSKIEDSLLKQSPKNSLVTRLEKEKYKTVATFVPDSRYYNLFGNAKDLYLTGIITIPMSIIVYER